MPAASGPTLSCRISARPGPTYHSASAVSSPRGTRSPWSTPFTLQLVSCLVLDAAVQRPAYVSRHRQENRCFACGRGLAEESPADRLRVRHVDIVATPG